LPLFLPLSLLVALELRPHIDLHRTGHRLWLVIWVVALLLFKASVAYFMHPSNDNRLIAQQLGEQTPPDSYASMVFIENTAEDYTIEEETPWGLRMYINKPIYGIPFRAAQADTALCHALHSWPTSLVVIDSYIPAEEVTPKLEACHVSSVTRVGTNWRKRVLERVER